MNKVKNKKSKLKVETCNCPIEVRKKLGETVNNYEVDIYFCEEHKTLELFNSNTEEKVLVNNEFED